MRCDNVLRLSAVLVLCSICGCASDSQTGGPAGVYYLDPGIDLSVLGRVALLELDNQSAYPQISAEMTEALYLETQKQQVFGVVVVARQDPVWHNLQEDLDSLQAMRQLAVLRETLRSNGLLLGTITQYKPYPHMVIGLRLSLLDLADGELVWAMEQVWDSTDKSLRRRIQKYHGQQLRLGPAPLKEELTVVSPLSFFRFVAYEVAVTFQPSRRR
jgi:hypothetical protein